MSLLDAFLPKDTIAKVDVAIASSEASRRNQVRLILSRFLPTPVSEAVLDEVLEASSQAPAVRRVAEIAGNNMIGEVLGKVADKLAS
jgi:hypothetical protein